MLQARTRTHLVTYKLALPGVSCFIESYERTQRTYHNVTLI